MGTDRLVIYGCGGHARSLADVALLNGYESLIFVDDYAKENEQLFGFKVVKSLNINPRDPVILALGDNQKRAELFQQLQHQQNIVSLIAKDAHLGKNSSIATGVFVGQGAHIGPNAKIQENTIINTHAVIEHDCVIGKHGHISVNTTIAGTCHIGDYVMVGAGATVIDGIKICSDVIIGAGAVVVKNITIPGTYVGVPAKQL